MNRTPVGASLRSIQSHRSPTYYVLYDVLYDVLYVAHYTTYVYWPTLTPSLSPECGARLRSAEQVADPGAEPSQRLRTGRGAHPRTCREVGAPRGDNWSEATLVGTRTPSGQGLTYLGVLGIRRGLHPHVVLPFAAELLAVRKVAHPVAVPLVRLPLPLRPRRWHQTMVLDHPTPRNLHVCAPDAFKFPYPFLIPS
eukprot:5959302-Pyramimonas_sp.AAC.1